MTNPGILTYAVSGNRRRILLLWLLGSALLALSLVWPLQLGRLTNLFSQGRQATWGEVNRAVLLLVAAQLGISGLGYWKRRYELKLNGAIIGALTMDAFRRILRFPATFFRDREVEKINTRAIEDSNKVAEFSLEAVVEIPLAVASLLLFGAVMLRSNWVLGLCMIPLSLLSGYFIFFDRRIQSLNRRIRETWETIRAETGQTIAGAADIRSNGAFEYAMAGISRTMGKYGPVAGEIGRLNALFQAIDPVIGVIRSGLLYWLGAGLCMAGTRLTNLGGPMTWGQVVTFMLLASLFERPTSRIASFILRWRMAQESIRRWKEYMDMPTSFDTTAGAAQMPPSGGPIQFRGVQVVAASGARILDGIDLEIAPGEHVAFAGPAGSGKSTLLHLASRSADLSGGRLLFSGKALDEYDFSSLVREVGVVPQKAMIFNTTLRSNILLGLRRPSTKGLDDDEGQVDISRLNGVTDAATLDTELLRVVRAVGLEMDVFKRSLDNPLLAGPAVSGIRVQLAELGGEIRRRLTKEGLPLFVPFRRDAIVFGTLSDNLFGPGGVLPDATGAAASRLFACLKGGDLQKDLVQYGWFRLRSEQSLAAQALQRAPQLREYLRAPAGLEQAKVDAAADTLGEGVHGLSRELQELMVAGILTTDIAQVLEALKGRGAEARILAAREQIFGNKGNWPACWSPALPGALLEGLSLRENLLWGRTNTVLHGAADEVDRVIWAVLEERSLTAGALLTGLESRTGEGGKFLSEGQRQKVALARALLKNPSVLLMDEATASLDEASQAKVIDLIGSAFADKTVVSISHRLSTIQEFDRVVVLDRGQLAQQGTYEALLQQEGLFRTLASHDPTGERSTSHRASPSTPPAAGPSADAVRFPSSELQRQLALCPIFSHLQSDQLEFLERISRKVECASGQVLFRRGDRGEDLFLVLQGEVEFFLERKTGDTTATEVIHAYGVGKAFGELALFGAGVRTAGARARTALVLCAIGREDLMRLIGADPQIGIGLLRGLSQRMIAITDRDLQAS